MSPGVVVESVSLFYSFERQGHGKGELSLVSAAGNRFLMSVMRRSEVAGCYRDVCGRQDFERKRND